MHSSHMRAKRRPRGPGYAPHSAPSRAGSSACAQAELPRASSSSASAARIAARSASSGSGLISTSTLRRLMPPASPVDDETVRQRLLSLAVATALAALGAAAASGAPGRLPNWAAPQIATVVAHGLMGATSVRDFQPNAVLTRQALADLASGLEQELAAPPASLPAPPTAATTTAATTTTTTTAASGGSSSPRTSATAGGAGPAPAPGGPPQVSNPDGVVTMAELDRRLVAALGLTRAAQEFAQGARAAGIPVPSRFGSEVVARLLGLRINHPAAQDFLELRPQDPATRAEAAYSAAQILGF